MKIKSLIASIMMVCAGFTASAQMYGGSSASSSSAGAGTITYGAKVGLTFATMKMSGGGISIESDNLTGFQVGAIANYAVSDMFSVQPELLYVQKGGTYGEGTEKMEFRSNYLEVPVLAKVSFGSDMVRGFVTGGPSLGYWLSGNVDGEDVNFDEGGANRMELGLNFGAGVQYSAFVLDVRYGLGLTNMLDEEGGDFTSKNRVVSLSLGYMFGR